MLLILSYFRLLACLFCFLLVFHRRSLLLLSTSQLHTTSLHDRCLYIPKAVYTHLSHNNSIHCILSSYLLSSSIQSPSRRPNQRSVCNYSLVNERGVKKIATSGRIWQDERDRFEDFPVLPKYPPPSIRTPIQQHRHPSLHSVGGRQIFPPWYPAQICMRLRVYTSVVTLTQIRRSSSFSMVPVPSFSGSASSENSL